MLLGRFCVDSINKEKIWVSDVVPLLFIDSLFQLWRNGGYDILGARSTHYPHVLGWLHKDLYLFVNIAWMASLPRLYIK